jgi:hypothetical protein
MRFISFAFVVALALLPRLVQAQTVCVVLNAGGTVVLAENPSCVAGTTSISATDTRLTTFQASVTAANNDAAYNAAYAAKIAPGFALTSSSLGCLPCHFPVDGGAQSNLSLQYQSITNDVIVQGYISGPTLTIMSLVSGNPSANNYVVGTGVAAGTEVTSGSGLTWTVNPSQTVGSSGSPIYMFIGGLGTGWVTGSTAPISDVSKTPHNFNPIQFLNYRTALGVLSNCSEQAWLANSNAFPSSCTLAATIP